MTLRDNTIILIGLGAALIWWILESAIHVVVFGEGTFIRQLFSPDSHELWMRTLTFVVIVAFGICAQISFNRQKQAEVEVRKAHASLDQIFQTAADGMRVVDRDFNVLRVNDTFLNLAGIRRNEVAGRKCYEVFSGPLCHTPDCPLTRILAGEESVTGEIEKEKRDGSRVPCLLTATPFRQPDGELIGIVEDFRDITELKHTQEELKKHRDHLQELVEQRTAELTESNEQLRQEIAERRRVEEEIRFRNIILSTEQETSPDCILVVDETRKIISFNRCFIDLWEIPDEVISSQSEERVLQSVMEKLSDPEGFLARVNYLYAHKEERIYEEILLKDGGILERNTAPMLGQDGRYYGRVWYFRDITGRKQAEEKLKRFNEELEQQVRQRTDEINASLQEKVLLLREIHHRVKNNLQIIISLINLQMRQIDDKQLKQVMAETQNRVKAISLVHEKLYQSKDISHIDLYDYTRFLVSQLFAFYGVHSRKVTVNIDIGKIILDINTAIPLGLILNELVSNSLKHAFPDGSEGKWEISISIGKQNDTLSIRVMDNGTGIPADVDWRNAESLGFRLVVSLVEQLDGTIEREPGEGTRFLIRVHQAVDESGKSRGTCNPVAE
ncbi:MAG: histidine kinase dimerization/phosphoacceptor domain -containing protein [Methanoregula sp.]|nr:histidine kinase dimerization/phosphoacceptor domain -containing protein [Methanoregula sp.]